MAGIETQFLVPAADEKEVVVLTDSKGSASLLITKADTMVLSGPATELLRKAYLAPTPQQLKTVAGATQIKDKQVVDWFVQSAAAKVFTLTATKPRVTKETTRKILAGDAISETLFNGSKIAVEHPGTVRTRAVNGVTLNWYLSDRVFDSPVLGLIGSVGMPRGPLGTSLIPRPVGDVGINCAGCAVCAVCAGCNGCVFCGPSPAAVTTVVNVDTAITAVAVSAASASFQALRRQDS